MPKVQVMALTITATPPVTPVPPPTPRAVPPVAHAAPPAAPASHAAPAAQAAAASQAAPAASPAEQQAALNRLLTKYRYDLSHDAAPSALSSLGRQITVAARAAGQRVTLPHASASAASAPAAAEAAPAPGASVVNVTA
jgi:transglutaminase-like putative cysteine protease